MRFVLDVDPDQVPVALSATVMLISRVLTSALVQLNASSLGPVRAASFTLMVNGVEVKMRLEP